MWPHSITSFVSSFNNYWVSWNQSIECIDHHGYKSTDDVVEISCILFIVSLVFRKHPECKSIGSIVDFASFLFLCTLWLLELSGQRHRCQCLFGLSCRFLWVFLLALGWVLVYYRILLVVLTLYIQELYGNSTCS